MKALQSDLEKLTKVRIYVQKYSSNTYLIINNNHNPFQRKWKERAGPKPVAKDQVHAHCGEIRTWEDMR